MKSKRSRSGVTNEPACLTCSPSNFDEGRLQQVGGRWLSAVARPTFRSTLKVAVSPVRRGAGYDLAYMHEQFRQRLAGVADSDFGVGGDDAALVTGLAARFTVEGGDRSDDFNTGTLRSAGLPVARREGWRALRPGR